MEKNGIRHCPVAIARFWQVSLAGFQPAFARFGQINGYIQTDSNDFG
jgi:hypothetical protein